MRIFKLSSYLIGSFFLSGCMGNPNGPSPINYPYFEVTKPCVVKNILVPTGTKLIYEKHLLKEGRQDKEMSEEKLQTIEFIHNKTIIWGGVPITSITKYFNTEMSGFTVYANFDQLSTNKKTRFSELWQSCNDNIGIDVKNTGDWSFNKENILDVRSCGVNYQRYFKEDSAQQRFLNDIYNELLKVYANKNLIE